MRDPSKAAEAAVPSIPAIPSIPSIPGMGNPYEAAETAAAKAAVPEPAPRPVPEFVLEIDQNGCLVLLADFFTSLKEKN